MGNPGEGSDRAWNLDFRAASVRKRSGGGGVFLLSATPAKNSPLEFYNLLQLVDPKLWTATGITNPEAFISRYMQVELRTVLNTAMQAQDRGAVVGFRNLDELRDLLFRYADFKTADDVGLELPEPKVKVVEVDMDDEQEGLYDDYSAQIEEALASDDPTEKRAILGLLARMSLVSIHARMEGMDWRKAQKAKVHADSPKFLACARRVLANRHCGHIIFCDNTAAHWWMRQVLVNQGIDPERIAILNAEMAKTPAERQRIAEAFNGNPDEEVAPLYDVVIANAVAYEGVDLQTRTCAIHHIDLPWEPATLQQRNGRGVRQGNTLDTIGIYYYFARRSMDGLRFNLIQGKRGWLTQLVKSQDRDTNNPGAQSEMGAEDVLLLISRDPDKTRKLLEKKKAAEVAKRRRELSDAAGNILRAVDTRFRRAERASDPAEAARLRDEAGGKLAELAKWDRDAWPWAEWMYVVRDRPVAVAPSTDENPASANMPVYEGMRLATPDAYDPEKLRFAEIGRLWEFSGVERVSLREAGSAAWSERTLEEFAKTLGLGPDALRVPWPVEADAELDGTILASVKRRNSPYTDPWPGLNWRARASEAFLSRAWDVGGLELLRLMAAVRSSHVEKYQKLPVIEGTGLVVLSGPAAKGRRVLPFTETGWREFLERAPRSGLRFTELNEAASYWWGRRLPRSLLADARREAAA
ncbi:MAG: hypothetical protein H6739_04755 [Alphaproteobacteria bacterium]|nr:hypothetical protein [Alphaproteobacteria bacterium]